MDNNWYGREIVDLLASRNEPLDLKTADAGHTSRGNRIVMLSRGGSELSLCVTEIHPGDAVKRLTAMLEYYPQPAAINGDEVDRKEPPAGIGIVRYVYSGDTASSYQVTYPGDADAPAVAFGFNALIAGVRFQVHGHPLPWEVNYHVRQPGSGNRFWQRAIEHHCRSLTPISADELNQLESLDRSRGLHIRRETPLWRRLRQETMDRLQAAIDAGKAPPREKGDVYQMSLGRDASFDEMHGGGAPIFVAGTAVRMDDSQATGAQFVTAAHALYQAEQELVPVSGRITHRHTVHVSHEVAPNDGGLPPILFVDAVTNGRRPEDQDLSFAPITNVAAVTVHVGENRKAVTVPADLVIEGQKYDVRVSYRPGAITAGTVSDLLSQAFWDQDDFNECANADDALDEMRSDYHEQAVAGMESLNQGFSMQMKRMVERLGTSVDNPDEPMSVTSIDGRFTLTYNGRAASGAK